MTNKQETPELVRKVVIEAAKIVSEMAGIQLGDRQESMVENRLKTRMLKLGIQYFEDYLNFLRQNQETESQALLSLLTTHHTYFFREFSHFEYLLNHGLNTMIEQARKRPDKTIKIWSAACSRGQEVYSLAMFFNFHLKHIAPDVKFEIFASDVDPESVDIAKNGVYKNEELKQCPAMYMEGNWSKGSGDVADFSRVRDSLKAYCKFQPVNLFQPEKFLQGKTFDLIFCRNVFIYFKPEQIKQITTSFLNHLDKQGYLFLGVSETLNGLDLPVALTGPSVYRHKEAVAAKTSRSTLGSDHYKVPSTLLNDPKLVKAFDEPTPAEKKVYEILCVDDSATIHALLAKILTEDHHFKITAKAMNGREALEILKTKKFDGITLDLHMPEIDGVGFLKEYKGTAPVVVLSSINRDDPSVAQQAVSLGAKDYIEKPSLENFAQACNEIRSKLKTVLSMNEVKAQPVAKPSLVKTAASTTSSSSITSSQVALKPKPSYTPSKSLTVSKQSVAPKPSVSASGFKSSTLTKPSTPYQRPSALNSKLTTTSTSQTTSSYRSSTVSSVAAKPSAFNKTSSPAFKPTTAKTSSLVASTTATSTVSKTSLNKPTTLVSKTVTPSAKFSNLTKTPDLKNKPVTSLVAKPTLVALKKQESPAKDAKSSALKKIRTLIVDDSSTIRKLLRGILSADSMFEVVAEAEKPSQVDALIQQHKPDLITLDIHMPEMDGVTLLKKYLPKFKIPTVMISSISKEEGPYVLDALDSGAVDYIQKPEMHQLADASNLIIERLKTAAQVKVKLRKNTVKTVQSAKTFADLESLIVIGASTGGTEALKEVLMGLPKQIPPICIVQHIPPIFSAAFAQRLNSILPFEVKEAQDGDVVEPNKVLIAPGGKQMAMKKKGSQLVVTINDDGPVNRHKPSVDYFFKTVAQVGHKNLIAGILTGMGADGANELKTLRQQGAQTFSQDEESSVVYGMPKEAFARGGSQVELPLEEIASHMVELSYKSAKKAA